MVADYQVLIRDPEVKELHAKNCIDCGQEEEHCQAAEIQWSPAIRHQYQKTYGKKQNEDQIEKESANAYEKIA